MPIGGCDHNVRGEAYNSVTVEEGPVLVDGRYVWDGTSTPETGCDGQMTYIRTRNTSATETWYATLPNKKRGGKYFEIPPLTDVTITSQGTFNSLGLSTYKDFQGVGIHATNTPPGPTVK